MYSLVFSPYNPPLFQAFSVSHWLAIGLLLMAIYFLWRFRGPLAEKPGNRTNQMLRWVMAALLILAEVILQWWYFHWGIWEASDSLPFHLCSAAVILCPVMLVTRNYRLYEVLFFWGMAGTSQAVLTPDLWYGVSHFIFFQYFFAHGLIIIACLWMTLVEKYRPTGKSVFRAIIYTNLYALFVLPLNYLLGANYLFLMAKPSQPSILDYLAPWPWYLLQLEILLILSCLLCYLPFWIMKKSPNWGQSPFRRKR